MKHFITVSDQQGRKTLVSVEDITTVEELPPSTGSRCVITLRTTQRVSTVHTMAQIEEKLTSVNRV